MLERNKAEIDALFDKRREMEETEFLEKRQEREKFFQQQIEELRTNNADDYNKCKIAMERGIQELEQHLEKMTSTYLLNKEKLEYNLSVLIERNNEHHAIQSSYKNRLNRLRETLNNLMTRYNTLDHKYRHDNIGLTEEYKRLTRQFKDLQEKFHHFERADEARFREVWEMNESEVRTLMQKCSMPTDCSMSNSWATSGCSRRTISCRLSWTPSRSQVRPQGRARQFSQTSRPCLSLESTPRRKLKRFWT